MTHCLSKKNQYMQQGDALKDSDALFSSFLERKGHVKGKILTYSTATTCTELRTDLWPQKTT